MVDGALVRRAADLLCGYAFKPWFYGDSVGLEGLLEASALLDDPYYEGFVHGLGRGSFARDPAFRELDNTVAGRALTTVAVRRGDSALFTQLVELAGALRTRPTLGGAPVSLRSAGLVRPYGGADLSPAEAALLADPGPAVYVDCLHFDPPFLAALGAAAEDDALLDEAATVAAAYVDLLQCEGGLFAHFALGRTGRTYSIGWSRGQGWALLGLLDTIELLGPRSQRSSPLETAARALVDAMLPLQLPSGHWPALATDPESAVESSTAAFFATGLAKGVRLGVLEPAASPAGARAFDATMASVDDQGRLRDVSAVVWSSTNPAHYAHVSRDHLVPWGQGPLLLALAEWSRREEGNR